MREFKTCLFHGICAFVDHRSLSRPDRDYYIQKEEGIMTSLIFSHFCCAKSYWNKYDECNRHDNDPYCIYVLLLFSLEKGKEKFVLNKS